MFNNGFEKQALNTRLLLGALGGAAGLGLAGAGGYAYGAHRNEPVPGQLNMPGQDPTNVVGSRQAMNELSDNLNDVSDEVQGGEIVNEDEYYGALQNAWDDAIDEGDIYKLSNDQGKIMAREFLSELSKIATVCVRELREAGMVEPQVTAPFEKGAFDLTTLSDALITYGVALADQQNPR